MKRKEVQELLKKNPLSLSIIDVASLAVSREIFKEKFKNNQEDKISKSRKIERRDIHILVVKK